LEELDFDMLDSGAKDALGGEVDTWDEMQGGQLHLCGYLNCEMYPSFAKKF